MGGLQYNAGPGGLFYSPARDMAYNYPQMIACCVRCFNADFWPQLTEILRASSVPPMEEAALIEELEKAQIAQLEFLKICCENPDEDIKDVFERSGWNDVSELARVGWTAMMGNVILGQVFTGLRDITTGGESVRSSLRDLLNGLADSRRAMNGIDKKDEQETVLAKVKLAAQVARDCGINETEIENAVKAALQAPQL